MSGVHTIISGVIELPNSIMRLCINLDNFAIGLALLSRVRWHNGKRFTLNLSYHMEMFNRPNVARVFSIEETSSRTFGTCVHNLVKKIPARHRRDLYAITNLRVNFRRDFRVSLAELTASRQRNFPSPERLGHNPENIIYIISSTFRLLYLLSNFLPFIMASTELFVARIFAIRLKEMGKDTSVSSRVCVGSCFRSRVLRQMGYSLTTALLFIRYDNCDVIVMWKWVTFS